MSQSFWRHLRTMILNQFQTSSKPILRLQISPLPFGKAANTRLNVKAPVPAACPMRQLLVWAEMGGSDGCPFVRADLKLDSGDAAKFASEGVCQFWLTGGSRDGAGGCHGFSVFIQ